MVLVAAVARSLACWMICEPCRASRATSWSDAVIRAIDSATEPTRVLRLVAAMLCTIEPTLTDTSSLAELDAGDVRAHLLGRRRHGGDALVVSLLGSRRDRLQPAW